MRWWSNFCLLMAVVSLCAAVVTLATGHLETFAGAEVVLAIVWAGFGLWVRLGS